MVYEYTIRDIFFFFRAILRIMFFTVIYIYISLSLEFLTVIRSTTAPYSALLFISIYLKMVFLMFTFKYQSSFPSLLFIEINFEMEFVIFALNTIPNPPLCFVLGLYLSYNRILIRAIHIWRKEFYFILNYMYNFRTEWIFTFWYI